MGNFDVKKFFGGMFTAVPENDYEEEVYDDGNYDVEEVEDTYYEEPVVEEQPYVAEPRSFVQEQPAVTTPVVQQNATVIMLTPYDIRTSQIVCDHIKQGHIVICNLTSSANNQRVVDYISGSVYALDGKIEPTPVKTTFVCTPKNVELIVDRIEDSQSGTKVSAL